MQNAPPGKLGVALQAEHKLQRLRSHAATREEGGMPPYRAVGMCWQRWLGWRQWRRWGMQSRLLEAITENPKHCSDDDWQNSCYEDTETSGCCRMAFGGRLVGPPCVRRFQHWPHSGSICLQQQGIALQMARTGHDPAAASRGSPALPTAKRE